MQTRIASVFAAAFSVLLLAGSFTLSLPHNQPIPEIVAVGADHPPLWEETANEQIAQSDLTFVSVYFQ